MSDLIIDADIAVKLCSGELPDILNLLGQRHEAGLRSWISTADQWQILDRLISIAKENRESNPEKAARMALKNLLARCMWLSALVEDCDGLDDPDPGTVRLLKVAQRLGHNSMVLTSSSTRLRRGKPFIDTASVKQLRINESIEFVDLMAQQDQIRPHLESNLHKVLHHGRYILGPEVMELENRLGEYVDVEHCVCVSSGTDALLVAMMALGIGTGDEVITSPFTFFSTAEVIALLGAVPVYVDIKNESFNIDPTRVEAAITKRTKAIIAVSLYGQCPDIDQINAVAARNGLAVIEDAAQSFGASYKGRLSCSLTTIGCTSFFPAKPLGAYGDAGACMTHDANLAKSMREIMNHGQGERYQHTRIGINGRMDSLQAAVLLSKLDVFDDELARRHQIAEKYTALLSEFEADGLVNLPKIEDYNTSSWAQYTIKLSRRELVKDRMLEAGIPTTVHYPKPLYAQPALYQRYVSCPNAEQVAEQVLSLPIHPYLRRSTQNRIIESLIEAINS